jgi:hypothetical protein
MTNAPTLQAIELPHPPEYSRDRKEFPNFISKVGSKLVGENGHFSDNQPKLHYIYGYLKSNTQNQIQPDIQTDKMFLEDIDALIQILEAAFSNPDKVRTASVELDYLMQGNREFSIYFSQFQCLMAILDYDSKAKKATLNRGLSKELPASLVYQTDKPEDFDKFVELCMKLDYRIQAHTTLTQHSNNSHPTATKATPSAPCTTSHPTSANSGNYRPTPMDLSAPKKSQNQCHHDKLIAKALCLYCGSADYFKDKCPILASNNAQKVCLAAIGISTSDLDSIPFPTLDLGKE